jgi:hypothetical protein
VPRRAAEEREAERRGSAPRPPEPAAVAAALGEPGGAETRRLRRAASAGGPASAPPIVHEVLRSSGETLDEGTRKRMEPRFGHSFAHVRVHAGGRAAESAAAVGAHAYAVGRSVVFGAGKYAPGSASGQRLIAHELAHVVQQAGSAGVALQPSLEIGPVDAPEEREAEAAAERVVSQRFALPGDDGGDDDPGLESFDQPLVLRRLAVGRLRRAATWAAGAVNATRNTAAQIASGGPAGTTLPSLNGTHLRGGAAAAAAIQAPGVATTAVAAGGFEAKVTSVPTNAGSFDETVLKPGPWATSAPKASLGTRLGLAACSGAGAAAFTAHGDPGDAALATANRTHEDHHAADDQAAFNGTIVRWDAALAAAQKSGNAFTGATAAGAEAALHTAMGGTPAQVAQSYWNQCDAAGAAFHATPAGGKLHVHDATADAACAAVSCKVSQ